MKKCILFVVLLFVAIPVYAGEIVVQVYLVNDKGLDQKIGIVTCTDSKYGLILMPKLSNLTPGIHGFHVHANPDCSSAMQGEQHVPALAAGGHFDPRKTNKHEGPYGNGHLGDLPYLYVDKDGMSTMPMLAPRLKTSDIKGKSLMIHAGGDNYSDTPAMLGGGGVRIACGVIK